MLRGHVAMKRGNKKQGNTKGEMLHLITCEAMMLLNPGEIVETIGELENLRGRREGKRPTYTQMTVVAVGDFMHSTKNMWESHRSMGTKD
jgi:hypothetical protein